MSRWLLHLEEPTRARLVRFIGEAHRAASDDLRIVSRRFCGFDAIALPPVDAAGGLEQVHVSVDCHRCMVTARAIEAPLPDTMMLNGPLLRRPSATSGVDDVVRSLERWRDRLSDPETIRSFERAARLRRDLSCLVRGVVQRFAGDWSRAVVRSSGTGRHQIRVRVADGAGGSRELEFGSGVSRAGVGGMSGMLVEAIDDIIGDHTHVSIWNGACPADRLPVTIGSTPFIDVGDPEDHMATMRGCAALPDEARLIRPGGAKG